MDKSTFDIAVGCYVDQFQALNGYPGVDEHGANRQLGHSHVATVYAYELKNDRARLAGVIIRCAAVFLMSEADVRVYHVLENVRDTASQSETPIVLRRIPEAAAIDVGNGFVLPADDPGDDVYVPYPGHTVEGGIGRQNLDERIQALVAIAEETTN